MLSIRRWGGWAQTPGASGVREPWCRDAATPPGHSRQSGARPSGPRSRPPCVTLPPEGDALVVLAHKLEGRLGRVEGLWGVWGTQEIFF